MSTIRLMSHNQWKCDQNLPDWIANGWDCSAETRTRGFVEVYKELLPDIIGCQEVSTWMADCLMRYTQEAGLRYALLWGRDTPIFYRQDKLELVDSDFFLYSEEFPDHEGSFNNAGTKSWCLAVFRVKETGTLFMYLTTHLWWKSSDPASKDYQPYSDEARAYQIGLAIHRVGEFQKKYNCPAVIVGDLNADYESLTVQKAIAEGFVHAHDIATDYADETNGHHYCFGDGYKPYDHKPFKAGIDHILLRGWPEDAVKRFDRWQPESYLALSDHAPVYIDIEI